MRLLDLSTAYGLWLLLSPLWLCSLGRFSGFLALVIHVVVGVVIRFYLLFTRGNKPMRLISLTYSHYVERARWCLDLLGEEYEEEHNIGIAGLLLQARSVPQLHVPAQAAVIGDSAAILRFLYAKSLGTDKEEAAAFLRPTEETLAMERRIEDVLGNQSRRWMYYHVFKCRDVCLKLWGMDEPKVPLWQRLLLRATYPVLKASIVNMLKINKESAERALAKVQGLFAELDEVFADGRPFIFGQNMTSADITLASLGYIAVYYENVSGGAASRPLPSLASLPPQFEEFAREVRKLRGTATGQFIDRMFSKHRTPAK